jgi:S1-C subfamily serine protease
MSVGFPRILAAGEREAGTLCSRCGNEMALGDDTCICRDCGAVHHAACWELNHGCSAYECSQPVKTSDASGSPTLTVSREELSAAQPLPARPTSSSIGSDETRNENLNRRWNRSAVAAFAVALLGIPLFGLVTGLVAIVIACVALAGHAHGRRGMSLAVIAIVIGLFDVIGWAVVLSRYLGSPHAMVAMDTLTLDPESLDALPDRISRAMRANVIIQSVAGLGRHAIGSGVIVQVRDGIAHIVTNRHIVDLRYTGDPRSATDLRELRSALQVTTVGQRPVPAKVEWIAPHGVDLAIISAPVLLDEVQEAHWDSNVTPHVSDEVFAIGNPHGLGWTHSAGDISQIRRQSHGDYDFRVLQTTAAINPGNSGGGLYDSEGRLIGINTMTGDKRFAEALGFSIALPTLLDLAPEHFRLPQENPEKQQSD